MSYIDENSVSVLNALSIADYQTIVRVCADPAVGAMCVVDGSTGSPSSRITAATDQNSRKTMMAVSSMDGKTPIPLLFDTVSGGLLIKTS